MVIDIKKDVIVCSLLLIVCSLIFLALVPSVSTIDTNKHLYFLDDKGNEIRIKSITKKPYQGKMYDVDVVNDIVLVKRHNLTVWSGNQSAGVSLRGIKWTLI